MRAIFLNVFELLLLINGFRGLLDEGKYSVVFGEVDWGNACG